MANIDNNKLLSQLEFLAIIDKMKNVNRQTLILDKSRQENDAEHSWHIAVMAMVLEEYAIGKPDVNKAVRLALVHDLVEVYAGDTFAYDEKGNVGKEEREREAARKLFAVLPESQGKEFMDLWEEFERAETPEGLYAVAVDRIQPFLANSLTDWHTWRTGKVKREQVERRLALVKKATPEIWEYLVKMLDKAEEGGMFKHREE
ncbi:MAG: HD domain-containing protein [Clostridiales bacterium]|nr:HD domain-containing protein [Clostridiales bacterium]